MLILTRKLGESIKIGNDIKISLLEIKGKQVKVGIEAPIDVAVHRDEIYNLIREHNIEAMKATNVEGERWSTIFDQLKVLLAKNKHDI